MCRSTARTSPPWRGLRHWSACQLHLLDKYPAQGELAEFTDRLTGGYIFENECQSFRARRNRELELASVKHSYDHPGRYAVAMKVIDIFCNETMTLVPMNVG